MLKIHFQLIQGRGSLFIVGTVYLCCVVDLGPPCLSTFAMNLL